MKKKGFSSVAIFVVLILFSSVWAFGCSSGRISDGGGNHIDNGGNNDGGGSTVDEFRFSKTSAGAVGFKFEDEPINDDEYIQNKGYVSSIDHKYEVSYSKRKASATYSELCSLGMDNDIFYPGALVDINTMTPISIPQAPLSISLGGAEGWIGNPGAPISANDIRPRTDTMREGVRGIINGILGNEDELPSTHGQLSFDVLEIQNEHDFQFNLGMGYKGYGLNIQNDFSFSKMSKSTNLVVMLKQVFYTVDISRPDSEYGFFADTVTEAQIRNVIPASKIPTYVASVSYGRIVMISIQTNFSKQEIENQLASTFSGALVGNVTVTSALKSMIDSYDTSISCFTYGGSQQDSYAIAAAAAGKDLAGIVSAMFRDYSPRNNIGMPLSYKFRHLDGSLALMRSSDEYDIKNVKYLPEKAINWSYLDSLIAEGKLAQMKELGLDFGFVTSATTLAARTIYIPANIDKLYLYGANDVRGDLVLSSMTISIRNRANPIEIILDNISFSGNASPAIFSNSSLINLKIVGNVRLSGASASPAVRVNDIVISGAGAGNYDLTLTGGSGTVVGNTGGDGAHALESVNLTVTSTNANSRFIAVGGNGRDSSSPSGQALGIAGGSGGSGIIATRDVVITGVFLQVKIVGGNGGNGAQSGSDPGNTGATYRNGGAGGNGGAAVIAANAYLNANNLHFVGGNGGNGAAGRGNAYVGGTAGNGGNGGDGGHALHVTDIGQIIPGNAFDGGTGGSGGARGTMSQANVTGRHGSAGSTGSSGGLYGNISYL